MWFVENCYSVELTKDFCSLEHVARSDDDDDDDDDGDDAVSGNNLQPSTARGCVVVIICV